MEKIDRKQYPQLNLLLWDDARQSVDAEDAFAVYERRWQFVDVNQLLPQEQALIRTLIETYGNGLLLANEQVAQLFMDKEGS